MAAVDIFEKFSKLQLVNYAGMEDFADRLNFQVTVILLLVCCTTVTLKTYVLSPVACFIPNVAGAHSGQENYVNNYCWTEGTFAVPPSEFYLDNSLDDPLGPYRSRKITYYQWVPFVVGLQALMFYMPRILWSVTSYKNAGTDVGHIVRTANDAVLAEGDKQKNLVEHVCRRLQQLLYQHPSSRKRKKELANGRRARLQLSVQRWFERWLVLPSRRLGNRLIFAYFLVKLCYLANAIGQLFLMRQFLGMNELNFAFGWAILRNLTSGRDWTQTMVFPRVGCCAVFYRTGSAGNFVFSQCTLPINMINEKMYIFIWFWCLCVGFVTLCSLPMWVTRVVWVRWRARFVDGYLSLGDSEGRVIDRRDRWRFVRDFLRQDGVFLLKMIDINAGDVVCTDVVKGLWSAYVQSQYGEERNDTEAQEGGAFFKPVPQQKELLAQEPRAEASHSGQGALVHRQMSEPVPAKAKEARKDEENEESWL